MVNVSSMRGGGSAAAREATPRAAPLIRSHNQLLIVSLDSYDAILNDEPVGQEPAGGSRIDYVFQLEYARGELIGRLAGTHAHGALDDDRPAIQLRGHEVDGAAVERDAGRQRPGVGFQSRKRRQQRRM